MLRRLVWIFTVRMRPEDTLSHCAVHFKTLAVDETAVEWKSKKVAFGNKEHTKDRKSETLVCTMMK